MVGGDEMTRWSRIGKKFLFPVTLRPAESALTTGQEVLKNKRHGSIFALDVCRDSSRTKRIGGRLAILPYAHKIKNFSIKFQHYFFQFKAFPE